MNKKLNEEDIIKLLHELDGYIKDSCTMIICGGAAIIVGFGIERTTGDVDALIVDPKNKSFTQGVKQVAEDNDLKLDWLNDGAKGYIDCLHPSYKKRLVPVNEGFKNLHVFCISKSDLITMKICAWRESDKEDVMALSPYKSDLQIILENIDYLSTLEPDKAHKAQLVLSELNLIPQKKIKIVDVNNFAELVQFYAQQEKKEPTMAQIVSWKSQINNGTSIKDIAKNYE